MEGAATTVYAQGGRGNARLVAWEGERTVTFTMEDALISPAGFSILTGAGLIDSKDKDIIMHTTEQTDNIKICDASGKTLTSGASAAYIEVALSQKPYLGKGNTGTALSDDTYTGMSYTVNDKEDFVYIMLLNDNGEVESEPYIAAESVVYDATSVSNGAPMYAVRFYATEQSNPSSDTTINGSSHSRTNDLSKFNSNSVVLVDYYVVHSSNEEAFQVDITPDKFGGNFYLEASTLFRATNGVDMPAEFVIPNCKVQSNFTFTMASSGDPSTFTFTMDAFPDYTRWDKTKKVFAAIQVLDRGDEKENLERLSTAHDIDSTYNTTQKSKIEDMYSGKGYELNKASSSTPST